MSTEEANEHIIVNAYLDRELSAEERERFEERLHVDPHLRRVLEEERAFRKAFRERIRKTQAPPEFRERMESLITSGRHSPQSPQRLSWWHRVWEWLQTPPSTSRWGLAMYAMLIVILIGSGVWASRTLLPAEKKHTVFRQLGGKHVVYTTGTPVLDIKGTPEEIANWFRPRFSGPIRVPQVPGWRLVGGRLGEFHHQPLVYLLYEQDGKYMGFLLFAAREDDFPPDARRDVGGQEVYVGFAWEHPVLIWREGEVGYALVGYAGQKIEEIQEVFLALTP